MVSAAWTPDGFMSAANRAVGRYLPPPPPGVRPPTRWGDEAFVYEQFAAAGPAEVTATVEHVRLDFASPVEAAAFWVRAAGHVQVERRLEASGAWEALHDDVAAVFAEWNREPGPAVRVESAYLSAVVRGGAAATSHGRRVSER
ncbi:hypothetical protein [Streptomyces sp. CB03238]|uniref:hypothetical protein n=1 Tax=Streptomyces sp. CB03238 TaxID=1907777 RepID=UPI000A122C74|nr:hypothetical protein [Streptomyces sp. CB03238]ORT55456.1 hypothetical protein BKD26_31885 [Streptomyces sp. CB03238]